MLHQLNHAPSEDVHLVSLYLKFITNKVNIEPLPTVIMQCILLFYSIIEYFAFISSDVLSTSNKTIIKKCKSPKDWKNYAICNAWFQSVSRCVIIWEMTIIKCSQYGGVSISLISNTNSVKHAYNISGVVKINDRHPEYECKKMFECNETLKLILDLQTAKIYVAQKDEKNIYLAFENVKIAANISYNLCLSLYDVGNEVRLNKCYFGTVDGFKLIYYKQ